MSQKLPYEVVMDRIKSNIERINFDVNYVAEEAYQKGCEEGERRAKTQAELDVAHDIENVAKGNYQKGLSDAWECARKIICFTIDGGIVAEKLRSIFETISEAVIMRDFSASEAMKKIRAYEEDEDKICVGDEVWNKNRYCKAVVIDQSGEGIFIVLTENGCVDEWDQDYFVKTGKHHGEVTELVEKLRAEE